MRDSLNPMYIAEISANHLGSFDRAKKLVLAAIDSGATAVKFQTYTADTMTLDIDTPEFRISDDHPLWGGRTLYSLYQEAHTPWEWHSDLFKLCRENGVIPFSSPFDATAVDFLEEQGAQIYKIASMETGDIPLIRKVASTGKPIIMSTGTTQWNEIEEAVAAVYSTGNRDLTLLVCTSSYPSTPKDAHINRMSTIRNHFGVKVGLSDHSLGIGVSVAALTLGAVAIEKHLTLRRSDGGADGAFSMEPEEFSLLVKEGNAAVQALGNSEWTIQESEKESRRLRRSLYIVSDVKMGEVVTHDNVKSLRPDGGCPPKMIDQLIGSRFVADFRMGTAMDVSLIEAKD